MIKFALLVFVGAYLTVCVTSLPPCVCTRNFKPVCGSDGNTYANQCSLECEQSKTNGLTKARDGPCELPAAPVCICPLIYSPVCGNDGQTYPNECTLNCEKGRKPELELRSRGNCEKETVKVAELPLPQCTCTRDLRWVCGTDGQTYPNVCLLKCAAEQRGKSIEVDYAGQCDESRVNVVETADNGPANIPCTCTRDLKPVCGSDGVTYNNECLLRCAGKDLTVKREGSC